MTKDGTGNGGEKTPGTKNPYVRADKGKPNDFRTASGSEILQQTTEQEQEEEATGNEIEVNTDNTASTPLPSKPAHNILKSGWMPKTPATLKALPGFPNNLKTAPKATPAKATASTPASMPKPAAKPTKQAANKTPQQKKTTAPPSDPSAKTSDSAGYKTTGLDDQAQDLTEDTPEKEAPVIPWTLNSTKKTPVDPMSQLTDAEVLNAEPPSVKYHVPEEQYQYNPALNTNPKVKQNHEMVTDQFILDLQVEHSTFEEATETLTPQAILRKKLKKLRSSLTKCSNQMKHIARQISKIEEDPRIVPKSLRIKPKLDLEQGLEKLPNIGVHLDRINQDMCALADQYKRQGTALLLQQLKVRKFGLRVQLATVFLTGLADVTQFQISYHRGMHPDQKDPKQISHLMLAHVLVYKTLGKIHVDILGFLDCNRTILEQIFLNYYPDVRPTSELCKQDQDTYYHCLKDTLRYAKHITIIHYNKVTEASLSKAAEAKVIAEIEAADAGSSGAAMNQALTQEASTAPKTEGGLSTAIIDVVQEKFGLTPSTGKATKKRSGEPNPGNSTKAKRTKLAKNKSATKTKPPEKTTPKSTDKQETKPAGKSRTTKRKEKSKKKEKTKKAPVTTTKKTKGKRVTKTKPSKK